MTNQHTLSIAVATLAASLAAGTTAAGASPLHVDAEIDPTAYALSGNSIHVGIGYDQYRLDLGNFAMRVPQFVHGDDGFDVSFAGYGVKLQMFPFSEHQRGLFAGIDGEVTRVLVQRQGGAMAERQNQLGAGVHVGYRIAIVDRLYVTPWIGVGYQFGASDVTLGGATYKASPISVFPAIHLGYQFE
jgi:hypothetical protein